MLDYDHVVLYARYLCSRDALGLKAEQRPSAARDDRVSCIQHVVLLRLSARYL